MVESPYSDRGSDFESKCNMGTFELEPVTADKDADELRAMIEKHEQHTGSSVAREILGNWESELPRFKKVMPMDYKRVLAEMATEQDVAVAANP